MSRNVSFVFILVFILCFRGIEETTPYHFPELKFFPEMPLAKNNPVTIEGADLGRHLFYDPILSDDSSMSCSSCHKQQSAFSDSPKRFSSGKNGELMKRNTMPLFNLAWYTAMFWDGRASSIEEQIFHPVRMNNEMNLQWKIASERLNRNNFYRERFIKLYGSAEVDSVQVTNVIAQFLRTLISNQSRYDKVLNKLDHFTKDEFDGLVLMNDQTKGDCLHCHTTDANALGTTLQFSNNGLDTAGKPEYYRDKGRGEATGNINDFGKFAIPSLRNVVLTAPYMHDGRFKTLEEVLDFYSDGVKNSVNIDSKMEFVHRGGAQLSDEEKRKIISFMMTLTDSVFISDPAFSNPFNNQTQSLLRH